MRCTRRSNSTEEYDPVDLTDEYPDESKKMACWKKGLIITGIVIFCIALLLFILAFVVLPIVFMMSISLERFFMFMNIDAPKNPNFKDPAQYGITGVTNFYVVTEDYETDYKTLVNIGAWLIQPEALKDSKESNVTKILSETTSPIVLYFHGVACNRILPISGYNVLRKQFLVIGIDYRGFGDSSEDAELSELGAVNDIAQVYQWVRARTSQKMYVWGHSLGTALSTHMVAVLKSKNIVPMGLVLESPFTTMADEVVENPLGKIFSWLAYFKQTFLDPLRYHGFLFETTKNILKVDCPIMIMHAEDDNVIPYKLGRRLAQIASTERNLAYQGNVTYHQFGSLGYKHVGITNDPHIYEYVKEFLAICEYYDKGKG